MADTAEVMATMEVTTVTTAEDPTSIFSATATDEAGTLNIIANVVPRVAVLDIPVVAVTAVMAAAEVGAMGEAEDGVKPHNSRADLIIL